MTRPALLALLLLASGCTTARVTAGGRYGVATRAWLTAWHVVDGAADVKVGNQTVDVIALAPGPEPLALLVPRGEPGTVRHPQPGDSGSPCYDAQGRYVGALVGERGQLVVVTGADR